jgi:broad specificity phosphatase PhoE
MNSTLRCLLAALLSGFAAASLAQAPDLAKLADELKQGGCVIVFRHGATNRDMADTDPLNHDNIDQQRQLSENGRKVAREVGDSFQKLGIPLGKIYSSRFNRALETAQLVGRGKVIPTLDVTEGGLVVTPIENDRRAEAFRRLVATRPDAGTNTLIVTHKPNILDALGKDWFEVREGEASVFRPDGSGKMVLLGRLQAADWVKAAAGR